MAVKFGGIILSTMLGLVVLSSGAIAQQKTIKACQDEWRANKATNQANGVTERSYVDQCRGHAAPIPPAAGPSQPVPAAPAQSSTPTPQPGPSTVAPSPGRPAPSAQTAPDGVNQFAVESQAKARCPSALCRLLRHRTLPHPHLRGQIHRQSEFRPLPHHRRPHNQGNHSRDPPGRGNKWSRGRPVWRPAAGDKRRRSS